MKRQTALEIICAILILLFTYTAISKLVDIRGFSHDMHNQPLPRWFTSFLIYFLPALELAIVGSLFFEYLRLAGLWTSVIIMFLFTVYTICILAGAFHRIPCSCGGVIENLSWTQHLFFNLFFIVFIIYAITIQTHKKNGKIIHA